MKQYLVFDLGGTFIKYAVMNEAYEILKQDKVEAPVDNAENFYKTLQSIYESQEESFDGVAISMPGRIDTEKGIAHTGGSYKFFLNEPVGETLSHLLKTNVTLANDGKCAANAEIREGALSDVDNGAVLVLGTGTGGGIVLNKKVWMGSTGAGGELSFLVMDAPGFQKDITNYHNLWAFQASASGLIGSYAVKKGEDFFQNEYNGIKVFEAYDQNDPDAIEALNELGKNVASGIFTLQAVLDLEKYAIGGGISARPEVTDIIREKVNEIFESVPFSIPFKKPEIVACRYQNNANLLGALRFHLDRIK